MLKTVAQQFLQLIFRWKIMRIKNEKRQAKYPAAYICPWRNWITQRIPIPENGGSNPFGQAKKGHPTGCPFLVCLESEGIWSRP